MCLFCRSTFLIAAALEVGATLLAFILYCRTCQLYRGKPATVATHEPETFSQAQEARDAEDVPDSEFYADCSCHVILNAGMTRTQD